MRTKDENKVQAIRQAVIDLSQADGFTNLTTANVAKQAGVSPATIYLYYKDKTDMLSRLYEEVKTDLHTGLSEAIVQAGPDLTAQVAAMLNFSVSQAQNFPKESHFISALWTNQELLDHQAREYGHQIIDPLVELYQRIQVDPEFIEASESILATLCSVPTMLLQTEQRVKDEEIKQTIQLVIKTLKK